MRVDEVDTPALFGLDAFEHNLKHLNESCAVLSSSPAPFKIHKCPQIALRQTALSAVGVCCQKVSEAEAMVRRCR